MCFSQPTIPPPLFLSVKIMFYVVRYITRVGEWLVWHTEKLSTRYFAETYYCLTWEWLWPSPYYFSHKKKQISRGELVCFLDLLFHWTYWKREHWSSIVNCLESVPQCDLRLLFELSLTRLPETKFYVFVKSMTYIDVYLCLTPWNFIATIRMAA